MVYFNPKWNEEYSSTYTGLEITDLYLYSIHKFIKRNNKDQAFLTHENKIVGYPNYNNKGIKVFPNQDKNKNGINQFSPSAIPRTLRYHEPQANLITFDILNITKIIINVT